MSDPIDEQWDLIWNTLAQKIATLDGVRAGVHTLRPDVRKVVFLGWGEFAESSWKARLEVERDGTTEHEYVSVDYAVEVDGRVRVERITPVPAPEHYVHEIGQTKAVTLEELPPEVREQVERQQREAIRDIVTQIAQQIDAAEDPGSQHVANLRSLRDSVLSGPGGPLDQAPEQAAADGYDEDELDRLRGLRTERERQAAEAAQSGGPAQYSASGEELEAAWGAAIKERWPEARRIHLGMGSPFNWEMPRANLSPPQHLQELRFLVGPEEEPRELTVEAIWELTPAGVQVTELRERTGAAAERPDSEDGEPELRRMGQWMEARQRIEAALRERWPDVRRVVFREYFPEPFGVMRGGRIEWSIPLRWDIKLDTGEEGPHETTVQVRLDDDGTLEIPAERQRGPSPYSLSFSHTYEDDDSITTTYVESDISSYNYWVSERDGGEEQQEGDGG